MRLVNHRSRRPLAAGLAVAVLAAGAAGVVAAAGGNVSSRPTATVAAKRQPVPAALVRTESLAEDIVDLALKRDRAGAVARANALRDTASGPAREALVREGVSRAQVARLESRAQRVARAADSARFLDVALAANGISALMPDLYSLYASPVPPEVLALDYLEREAQLRSRAGDHEAATKAVRRLDATWAHLKPAVVHAGATTLARRFDSHIAAMEAHVHTDTRALQQEAVRGLELVDRLEGVFLRS